VKAFVREAVFVPVCLTVRVHRRSELIERDDGNIMKDKAEQVSEWLCAKNVSDCTSLFQSTHMKLKSAQNM
jgi:hypothetical protein